MLTAPSRYASPLGDPEPAASARPATGFLLVGHRGAKDLAPENTAASFRLAEELGVDQIEFDVRITRDGIPVIVHDLTMERLAAAPGPYTEIAVSQLSLAQLQAIPLASGHAVLTLAEMLELTTCVLQMEIKDPCAVPAVAVLLRQFPAHKKRIRATSFLPEALSLLQRHLPDVPRGLILGRFPATAGGRQDMEDTLSSVEASALYTGFDNLTAADVERYRAAGLEVHVWPLSSPADMDRALQLNADGGTADDPRQAREWLKSAQAQVAAQPAGVL